VFGCLDIKEEEFTINKGEINTNYLKVMIMRVLTWNIGGGFILNKKNNQFDIEDINYFVNEIQKVNPDVVCLQEIHFSETNNQTQIIANALGYEHHEIESIAESHLKDGEKLSIALISKYPVDFFKFNKLSNPNLKFIWKGKEAYSHDKGFLEANINYDGKVIRILSGHMVPFRKFGKDFLSDEFKMIRDEIEEIILSSKVATIVCADMNFIGDIQQLIPNVFTRGFESILDDVPTTPNGRKYDKIIVSNDWKSINSNIVKGLADHYLCFADVELL